MQQLYDVGNRFISTLLNVGHYLISTTVKDLFNAIGLEGLDIIFDNFGNPSIIELLTGSGLLIIFGIMAFKFFKGIFT